MKHAIFSTLLGLALLGLAACAAELGDSCGPGVSCPSGAVCRDNLYLEDLCKEGVVPVEGSGPDAYCTVMCETSADCSELPNSDGCLHDPRSNRLLCKPDCSAYK
ncbi:MAG: hypothetical protein ABIJ09_01595 [Pseudomonadota bacterium]